MIALVGSVAVLPLVEIEFQHFARARQVQRVLASQGKRGRKIPDLLIAAAAEELQLIVLHYHADFDHIAHATGQRSEWIVSAGSVS
jgi:predicted nucleic acid-binding protein